MIIQIICYFVASCSFSIKSQEESQKIEFDRLRVCEVCGPFPPMPLLFLGVLGIRSKADLAQAIKSALYNN